MEIESIFQISLLAVAGETDWKQYGDVNTQTDGDLIIFNYSQKAIYEARWNFFERVSRGLIINKRTGEIVARPFDKFYNWMEGERTSSGRIVTITEKMDGSLGILYRDNGHYGIATRGSFTSDQAIWATKFLNTFYNLDGLPMDYTLLFEIVYPENRVVVDYQNSCDLYLLAIRHRFTGAYLPYQEVRRVASMYNFPTPLVFQFERIEDVIKRLPALNANQEGYVVEFSDGQRFKFKGAKYLELHRLISGLSFKNTLAAVASGTIDNIRSQIPEEFLEQFNGWVEEIEEGRSAVSEKVRAIYEESPKTSRKDFALWISEHFPPVYHPYLFAMFDNRDITPLIYKHAFRDRKDSKVLDVSEDAN